MEHIHSLFVVCIALHLPYCLERRNIKSRKNSLHVKREKGIQCFILQQSTSHLICLQCHLTCAGNKYLFEGN